MGPIKIHDIISKSNINLDALDFKNIGFRHYNAPNAYAYGTTNKQTGKINGLARIVSNKGFIIEGWIQNNKINGYGRFIDQKGGYSLGMHK